MLTEGKARLILTAVFLTVLFTGHTHVNAQSLLYERGGTASKEDEVSLVVFWGGPFTTERRDSLSLSDGSYRMTPSVARVFEDGKTPYTYNDGELLVEVTRSSRGASIVVTKYPDRVDYRAVVSARLFGGRAHLNFRITVTGSRPASPPSGLTATSPASDQITLNWGNVSSYAKTVEVERRTSTGDWDAIAMVNASSSYQDANVTGGLTYYYRARACDGSYCTTYSGESSARARSANLTVAVTLDDSTADQAQAVEIADRYGVKLTLYGISRRIGKQGYQTVEQIREWHANGHEIGGHTLSHRNLLPLSEDEVRHQVCGDRENFIKMGLPPPASFANPFGETSPLVEQVVAECGYRSARLVGGLSCRDCPAANPLPIHAGDLYRIAAPASVKSDTTLETLKSRVIMAEDAGGFLPLVFHHVSDDTQFDPHRISPSTFDAFLAWLTSRNEAGTVVRTVGSIVSRSAKSADRSQFGFEKGSQGFTSSGGMIPGVSSTGVNAYFGKRSLAVYILNQADTQQVYHLSPETPAGATVVFRVFVPANSGLSAIQPYVLEGPTGAWRWTGTYKSIEELRANEWNEIRVVVPPDAAVPLYSIGVEFFANGNTATTAYIDSIQW